MRILMDERGKKYMISNDKDFHSDFGFIKKEDIEKSEEGQILKSHMDKEFKVLKRDVNDYIQLMERRCSILLPKDVGIIMAYTGLGAGSVVVEGGTGAGTTALYFGNVVGDQGKVYSYEIREDFAQIAEKNVNGFGLENVEIKCKDMKEGIEEKDVDLIFLDLPKPWELVEGVKESLKVGGYLAAYNPYIEQFQILNKVLNKHDLKDIKTVECIFREMELKNKGTRPKTRMAGHTGYLTFARKL
ncbi:MAG: SAM-dependent methyltransferase [Methanobacterium sp. BRmetb2]|nr:MAG: SAM-dependent methyltransferase [Methanobacterium sp. BRmetb2]